MGTGRLNNLTEWQKSLLESPSITIFILLVWQLVNTASIQHGGEVADDICRIIQSILLWKFLWCSPMTVVHTSSGIGRAPILVWVSFNHTEWMMAPLHTGNSSSRQLTHCGRMTHICVGKTTIIGSDNGLWPGRRQAIIWTNAGILLIGT